ncbi:YhbY family RNA-binding protein [Achromobacter sp. GG226]|uniref:YhbY family RNA-binding protein n=1 Tax=Verticiella alkaliphila TaxID=2779529 RepID=UPI001C0CF546|nr:YhbY family RNA-binding protein [Verticiella sp. GG226]MBU4609888.1 YhbY family RNA-binding protein [Verticiella sp. GG226]
MPTIELESKMRSALRAAAHPLRPVVQIGDKGLSDAVVKEIDRALTAHGLIKVRAGGDERSERQAMLDDICERLGCAAVHHLGKILILFRPTESDPQARKLLDGRMPAPAASLGVQPRKSDEPHVPKKLAAEGKPAPARRKTEKPVRDDTSLSPRERYLGAAAARKASPARPARAGSALSLRAGARGRPAGGAGRPLAAARKRSKP